jgi:hypothetical protein
MAARFKLASGTNQAVLPKAELFSSSSLRKEEVSDIIEIVHTHYRVSVFIGRIRDPALT